LPVKDLNHKTVFSEPLYQLTHEVLNATGTFRRIWRQYQDPVIHPVFSKMTNE